jgi:hypothetical protein
MNKRWLSMGHGKTHILQRLRIKHFAEEALWIGHI